MAKMKGLFKGMKYISQIFGNALASHFLWFSPFQSSSSLFMQLLRNMRWRLAILLMWDMLHILAGTVALPMLLVGYITMLKQKNLMLHGFSMNSWVVSCCVFHADEWVQDCIWSGITCSWFVQRNLMGFTRQTWIHVHYFLVFSFYSSFSLTWIMWLWFLDFDQPRGLQQQPSGMFADGPRPEIPKAPKKTKRKKSKSSSPNSSTRSTSRTSRSRAGYSSISMGDSNETVNRWWAEMLRRNIIVILFQKINNNKKKILWLVMSF